MSSIQVSLEHPIVFVFDFDHDEIEIPKYSESRVVASNETCLSIRVISEVDGHARISLRNHTDCSSDTSLIEVFRGTIHSRSKKVAVVNAQNKKLMETETSKNEIELLVLVDNTELPEVVEVVVV